LTKSLQKYNGAVFLPRSVHYLLEMLKSLNFNNTDDRFVETGSLPVIRLRNIMCHVA